MVGGLYLLPTFREFQTLRQRNLDLQASSAELDELIQNKDALLKTINTISQSDLERIRRALPEGVAGAELLVFLENTANQNNLSLKRVDLAGITEGTATPGAPRPGGAPLGTGRTQEDTSEFPFSLDVAGTYENIKAFLVALENSLRIIDIQTISFGSPAQANFFDVSIRAKTYSKP